MSESVGWTAFRGDVTEAIRVWKTAPLVPCLAIAFAVASPLLVTLGVSGLDVMLTLSTIGFYGTQRLAFVHARAGRPMSSRLVVAASRAYWGRFAALGMWVGLFVFIPVGVALVPVLSTSDSDSGFDIPPLVTVLLLLAVFLLDVVLTFVTTALAFSTNKATEAFRQGRRYLRKTWTETRFHALLPPLIPLAAGQLLSRSNPVAAIAIAGAGAGVGVIARGAHSLAYLRDNQIVPAVVPGAPPDTS